MESWKTELYHHGILGMKWGIRRYQPYPAGYNGDGKFVGQKKFANQVNKTYKKVVQARKNKSVDEEKAFSDRLGDQVVSSANKVFSKEQIKDLSDARNKYLSLLDQYFENDYTNSEQCNIDADKAYKETVKWFEQNDKDYLKDIVKNNEGSYDKLDQFHDFRKTYEGFLELFWSEGEAKWNSEHPIKNLEKDLYSAHEKWLSASEKLTDQLLGEYGNKTIERNFESGYKRTTKEIVDNIVSYLDLEGSKYYYKLYR